MRGQHAAVIAGLPAAGKSIFARHLARAIPDAVVVDKDEITGPLVQAALAAAGQPHDLDGSFYKKWLSPACYEATLAVAMSVVEAGATPILVAPYESALTDARWHADMQHRLGLDLLHVFWLVATPEELRDRMIRRRAPRDRSKLDDWETWAAGLPVAAQPPWPHTRVDTTGRTALELGAEARSFARRIQDAQWQGP